VKLVKFEVEKFRSVENSDWIKAEDVACLVGTNEPRKTNWSRSRNILRNLNRVNHAEKKNNFKN
jgi:hypothetical protein